MRSGLHPHRRFLWLIPLVGLVTAFLAVAGVFCSAIAPADLIPAPAEPCKLQQIPAGSSVKGTAFLLNSPDRVHWPGRQQKDVGWCGESAIQQALLYHGGYFPQKTINEAGKPQHPDLYSNDIPVALDALRMRFDSWPADVADLPLFLEWLTYQIRSGAPVFVGAKINPTQHPDWALDHFMLATGVDSRRLLLNTTWGRQEWSRFEQLSGRQKGFSFANRFNMYLGIAITGPQAFTAGAVPVRLQPVVETESAARLMVTCEKLTPGEEYVVYKASTFAETGKAFAAFKAVSASYAFYDKADPRASGAYRCYARKSSPPSPETIAAAMRADQALAGKLAVQLPNINLKDVPLVDALKFAGEVSGVEIQADWTSLEAVGFKPGMIVRVSPNRSSGAALLWSVLLQAKASSGQQLGYRIIEGKVAIRLSGA